VSRINKFAKLAVLASASLAPGLALASNTTVCSIPAGRDGVTFTHENVTDMRASGPAAFTVAPDGSFWVVDTMARRLLHYSSDCRQLGILDVRNVVGISDIAVTNSSIYLYDRYAQQPVVIHLSLSGAEYGRHVVDRDVTGVMMGERGEVVTERLFGAAFQQLLDSSGKLAVTSLPGVTQDGVVYHAAGADLSKADASTGTITLGSRTLEVKVPNAVGGLRVLGVQRDGGFFAKMEEVALANGFRVDQTIRSYDAAGNLRGQARVPIQDNYAYVENNVAQGPSGDVFALMTYRGRAEIQKLGFSTTLSPILPVVTITQEDVAPPVTGQCRSATDMANTGSWFTGFARGYNSTNISGACSGRTRPRWLTTAGTAYTGVAYDWGGWDTPTIYDNALYNGRQAGDIDTVNPTGSNGVEACSVGADCSGLVSRAWNLGTKQSTSTLPSFSWQLANRSSLARGDVMNCAGSHVTMFDYYISNGIQNWEATTSFSADRSVYVGRDWTYFGNCNYLPRRFNSKC